MGVKAVVACYFGGYAIVLYAPYPYCLTGFILMTLAIGLLAKEAFKPESNPQKGREVFT